MTFLRQLNLEVKDDMAKHLKVETLSIKVKLVLIYQAIKVDLKKGQEATKLPKFLSYPGCNAGRDQVTLCGVCPNYVLGNRPWQRVQEEMQKRDR